MTDYEVYFKVSGDGCSGLSWEFGEDEKPTSFGSISSMGCSFLYKSVEESIKTMLSEIDKGRSERDTFRFIRGWSPWSAPVGYMQHYEKHIADLREFIESVSCEGHIRRMEEKTRLHKEKIRLQGVLRPYFPEGAEEIEEFIEDQIGKFGAIRDYILFGGEK